MKKNVIRVSDELLELIENPKLIRSGQYTHCLWCGMIKAFRNRPCEICGLWGNSAEVPGCTLTIRYDNAPAPRTKGKPGRRAAITQKQTGQ